jgi:hypothetical protein
MDTPKPKPRRKRRCAREGCKRGVRDGYRCCSYLCNVVTDRIDQTERMCRAIGPCPTNTDLWVAVTELGDVLTRLQHLETRMYRLAIEQGYTAEQWSAIKSGESDLAGSDRPRHLASASHGGNPWLQRRLIQTATTEH